MKEKYSHDKYVEFILAKKHKYDFPENKYKEQFIPDKLYKYSSFRTSHIDENLKNICAGKIWMPLAMTLNDPFEFQMIKDTLSSEKKAEFRSDTIERNTIMSLCPTLKNYLLWAHYADGHRGMCMEFNVTSKENTFPVMYLKKQEDMTEEIQRWLKMKKKMLEKPYDAWSNEEEAMCRVLHKIMLCKTYEWRYENEIRIIGRNIDQEMDEDIWTAPCGYWERLDLLGLELKRIILGFNCSLSDKAKVLEIVNRANELIIMSEMQRNDFKYSREITVEVLKENAALIKVAQMKRRKGSVAISPVDIKLETDGVIYGMS